MVKRPPSRLFGANSRWRSTEESHGYVVRRGDGTVRLDSAAHLDYCPGDEDACEDAKRPRSVGGCRAEEVMGDQRSVAAKR
jgi:hypothetical protein